jgi:hypothetical protein
MADRNADAALGGVSSELGRTGELRGQRHETDVAFGCVIEAVKESDVGGLEMPGRMDTALEVGEERAFEVNADWTGERDVVRRLVDLVGQPGSAWSVSLTGAVTVVAR